MLLDFIDSYQKTMPNVAKHLSLSTQGCIDFQHQRISYIQDITILNVDQDRKTILLRYFHNLRNLKLQKFFIQYYLTFSFRKTFDFLRKSDCVLFSLIIFLSFISFLILGRIITKQPSFYSTENLFRLTFKSMLFVNFRIVC